MSTLESYEQAEAFLLGRVNFERTSAGDGDFRLDRMRELLRSLDNPHLKSPAIHIAGTKGKGSTAATCASILAAAGHRVGLYISPHLERFEERFTVNGELATPEKIVRLMNRVREAVQILEHRSERAAPTFFEVVTALAWLHFAEEQVSVVVLEVGLGGRLDATNLCDPAVCVITSISRDHTAILGATHASIAREKGGIIKPAVPVISGAVGEEARAVIRQICESQRSPLWELDREIQVVDRGKSDRSENLDDRSLGRRVMDLRTPTAERSGLSVALSGAHQVRNAALAVAACDILESKGWSIPEPAIRDGLQSIAWPLRIEMVGRRPLLILDAAHNWASTKALLATLAADFPARPRTLIFGGTRDKDVSGLLRQLLPQFDRIILTKYVGNPRGFPLPALTRLVAAMTDRPTLTAANPRDALDAALSLAEPDDLICGTGSFFLAAELRSLVRERSNQSAPCEVAHLDAVPNAP